MALQNNAGIILTIFAFYITLIVLMGLSGQSGLGSASVIDNPSTDPGFFDTLLVFFQGIGFSLGALPIWANILLFLPLGITITYVVAELLAIAL